MAIQGESELIKSAGIYSQSIAQQYVQPVGEMAMQYSAIQQQVYQGVTDNFLNYKKAEEEKKQEMRMAAAKANQSLNDGTWDGTLSEDKLRKKLEVLNGRIEALNINDKNFNRKRDKLISEINVLTNFINAGDVQNHVTMQNIIEGNVDSRAMEMNNPNSTTWYRNIYDRKQGEYWGIHIADYKDDKEATVPYIYAKTNDTKLTKEDIEQIKIAIGDEEYSLEDDREEAIKYLEEKNIIVKPYNEIDWGIIENDVSGQTAAVDALTDATTYANSGVGEFTDYFSTLSDKLDRGLDNFSSQMYKLQTMEIDGKTMEKFFYTTDEGKNEVFSFINKYDLPDDIKKEYDTDGTPGISASDFVDDPATKDVNEATQKYERFVQEIFNPSQDNMEYSKQIHKEYILNAAENQFKKVRRLKQEAENKLNQQPGAVLFGGQQFSQATWKQSFAPSVNALTKSVNKPSENIDYEGAPWNPAILGWEYTNGQYIIYNADGTQTTYGNVKNAAIYLGFDNTNAPGAFPAGASQSTPIINNKKAEDYTQKEINDINELLKNQKLQVKMDSTSNLPILDSLNNIITIPLVEGEDDPDDDYVKSSLTGATGRQLNKLWRTDGAKDFIAKITADYGLPEGVSFEVINEKTIKVTNASGKTEQFTIHATNRNVRNSLKFAGIIN